MANFHEKQKCVNLGQKVSYLGISELEFKYDFALFEFSTLEFVSLKNFVKKWKCLNLGQKMPYLGIFWLEF